MRYRVAMTTPTWANVSERQRTSNEMTARLSSETRNHEHARTNGRTLPPDVPVLDTSVEESELFFIGHGTTIVILEACSTSHELA